MVDGDTREKSAGKLRCAYCHDAAVGASETCAGCGTILHRECMALAGVCPTLGCGTVVRPAEKVFEASDDRRATFDTAAFVVMAAMLIAPSSLVMMNGVPRWWSPFPFALIIPMLMGCMPAWLFVGPLTFWGLASTYPGSGFVHARVPLRTKVIVPLVTALGAWAVIGSIPYGVKWQGREHTMTVVGLNIALIAAIWVLFAVALRRPGRGTILALHWLFVFWLVWQAFPWLGELI